MQNTTAAAVSADTTSSVKTISENVNDSTKTISADEYAEYMRLKDAAK